MSVSDATLTRDAGKDTATITDGAERQATLISPLGLLCRPRSGARVLVLTAASGEEVALPVQVSPGDGLDAGEVALAAPGGARVRCRRDTVEASRKVDAPGYAAGGQDGVSGTLKITDSDGWSVTLVVAGGIIVSVTAGGSATWGPEGGA